MFSKLSITALVALVGLSSLHAVSASIYCDENVPGAIYECCASASKSLIISLLEDNWLTDSDKLDLLRDCVVAVRGDTEKYWCAPFFMSLNLS